MALAHDSFIVLLVSATISIFLTSIDAANVIHRFRVDDVCTAYMDGMYLMAGTFWEASYDVQVPDTTQLIAIQATDTSNIQSGAGFFILVNGTLLSTNNLKQWKCTQAKTSDSTWMTIHANWYKIAYDDSKWLPPFFVNWDFPGRNGYGAIWATGVDQGLTTVYCRGHTACFGVTCEAKKVCRSYGYSAHNCTCPDLFTGANCDQGVLQVQVDDQFTVYLDGSRNTSGNVAALVYETVIPSTVKVLGLDIADGGLKFFVRVLSPFIDSVNIGKWTCIIAKPADRTWLATYQGWTQTNFTEDSNWQEPVYRPTDVDGVKTFWASGIKTGPSNIYCRGKTACFDAPCAPHQVCKNLDMSNYQCVCMDGFTGSDCIIDIDDCASKPCPQICTDKVNGYSCSCNQGWTGLNCSNNINECISMPCLNGAACEDLLNGYKCTCVSGFAGTKCGDIKEIPTTSMSPIAQLGKTQTHHGGSKTGTIIIAVAAVCGAVVIIGTLGIIKVLKHRRTVKRKRDEQERLAKLEEEANSNAGWFSFLGSRPAEPPPPPAPEPATGGILSIIMGNDTNAQDGHDARAPGHDAHTHYADDAQHEHDTHHDQK